MPRKKTLYVGFVFRLVVWFLAIGLILPIRVIISGIDPFLREDDLYQMPVLVRVLPVAGRLGRRCVGFSGHLERPQFLQVLCASSTAFFS